MTVQWVEYLDEVLVDAPNVPKLAAIEAIRRGAIRFCRESRIWTGDCDPVSLVADQSTYTLTPPVGAAIVAVASVLVDGTPIAGPLTKDELDVLRPGWRTAKSNRPTAFLSGEPTIIRVTPIPTEYAADALDAEVSLKPARNAVGAPDFLAEDWREAIGHAAKAYLFALPGKPWNDGSQSIHHDSLYKSALGDARARLMKGGGDRSVYIEPTTLT